MGQKAFNLPPDHRPHTDVYFLHSRRILEGEGLNPRVTMRVFVRQGPGRVYGLEEAAAVLAGYAPLSEHGGEVWALPEGAEYASREPLMLIEAELQDIVELETMYLGAITAATTLGNGGKEPDPAGVRRLAEQIRGLMPDKRIMYFGSRHWHWDLDAELSRACVDGGFDACSTDHGARAAGLDAGVGTMPHALVLAFGAHYGASQGTARAVEAFDRHLPAEVPRIALVDTFNREVDDSLASARAIGRSLSGVRLDTPGEAVGQGGRPEGGPPFWTGTGVSVEGVAAVRRALDAHGCGFVNIVLSSGFSDLEKLLAFKEAEARLGRLFEGLGIGAMFPARNATADIVRVEGRHFAKLGRSFQPSRRLVRVI